MRMTKSSALFSCYHGAMKLGFRRLHPNTLVLLKQIGIGVIVLISVALLLTAVWYGTRIKSLTISEIQAVGGETIDTDSIELLAEVALEGDYLGLVPRRFVWLYPEAAIIQNVSQIERIHNIRVERQDRVKLLITYDEYVPRALWCTAVTDQNCLFLDDRGFAFSEAPNLSGGTFLRLVTTGRETAIGETIVEQTVFDNMLLLVALLEEQDWFVSHLEFDQVGDVFVQIAGGGELKVTIEETPAQIVENLLAALSSEEFSEVAPGNFKYIDLRYGNKIFVNRSGELPKEEGAESTP